MVLVIRLRAGSLQNVLEMHNGFCDFDDYLAANDQYNNDFLYSNELVGDLHFYINWLNDMLPNQGKRKFEEENLQGTKKMRFIDDC